MGEDSVNLRVLGGVRLSRGCEDSDGATGVRDGWLEKTVFIVGRGSKDEAGGLVERRGTEIN